MKRASGAIGISLGLALLQGCAASPATAAGAPAPAREPAPSPAAPVAPAAVAPASVPAADGAVASIDGRTITMSQLMQPLVEAHGLTVLLNLVQLELAKEAARREGVTVTEADFVAERKATLDKLFAEADQKTQDKIDDAVRKNKPDEAERLRKEMERDHEQLFEQFLQNQKVTRPEFELFLKTTTYLRKIAEPKILAAITDQDLRNSFDAEYGASVVVRIIQGSPQELGRALERLRAGEPFDVVAKQISRHAQTAGLGGELPRFSLATPGLPENFKTAAFALKEGEISNLVEAEGTYFLIKLEKKLAPKAVKFENMKEIVRENLKERTVQVAIKKYRDALGERARKELKITEPVMAGQFADKLADRDKQIKDQQELRRQMEKDREREGEQAPKAPGTAPAVPPATDLKPADVPTPGVDPAPAAPAPAPAPAPQSAKPAPRPLGEDPSGPIKPGIVVPVPGRATAPEAPADPARATKPAQQEAPAAPAGK